jgi:VWFA-related protein
MRRRFFLAATVFAAAAPLAAGAGARQDRPAPEGKPLLWIDAVALDNSGAPVLDVRPDEFEVWIGAYRIPIEQVRAVTPATSGGEGRTVIVLLDDLTMSPVLTARVRDIARLFVSQVAPGDRFAVVTLNGGGMKGTDDPGELNRAIDAYRPQQMPVRIDEAGRQMLKTIAALSGQLVEVSGGRKAIAAIGSPWLFDTPLPPPTSPLDDLRRDWVDAMLAAASAKATLYVIDPGGLGMARLPPGGSAGFARETGGYAFVNTNDFSAAVARILRETANHYLLGIVDPPVHRKDELRELDVRVLRKGVTVRARRGIPPGPR